MRVNYDQIQDSGKYLPAGRYFVVCTEADEANGERGDVGMEVVWTACWPEPARGKIQRETLWATGDHADRFKMCAKAIGLRTSGQDVEVTPPDFLGKTVWVEVIPARPFKARDGTMKTGFPQIAYAGYDGQTPPPPGVTLPSTPGALAAVAGKVAPTGVGVSSDPFAV
jgi:hypothetical protein